MSVDPGCAACWTTPGGCPVHWSPPSPQSSAYRPPVYGVENRSGGPGCHPECTDGWCHVAYVEGTPPNRDAQLARALAELSVLRQERADLERDLAAMRDAMASLPGRVNQSIDAALVEFARRINRIRVDMANRPATPTTVQAFFREMCDALDSLPPDCRDLLAD